ncbi:MAG: glycosyltransferase family 2 protein [Myxococcota bacterium]
MILPVRNAARTLDDALRSVLASRGVRLEVLCVDDGSRDGSSEILAEWARQDPRVAWRRSRGPGICAALNVALADARASYLARMDADDEMHPERLAAQAALLDARPDLCLVGCCVESFREDGLAEGYRLYTEWVNRLIEPDQIAREAFVECPVPHPTWMLRREAVERVGGYRDLGWPEDLDLLYRLLVRRESVGKVPRVLHRWRDHPERLSRTDPRYSREAFARVKAHFLPRIHPMSGAVVWGAGRTGRRFVKLLAAEGVLIRALIDIHPDRVGSSWREIPILDPAQLRLRWRAWRAEGLRILGAVASRGARCLIRGELLAQGMKEGEDFLMVA